MALLYKLAARQRIAHDLRAFMQPHGTTDQLFDGFCGWSNGTTRAILNGDDLPSAEQLIEICLRLHHSLSLYIGIAYSG